MFDPVDRIWEMQNSITELRNKLCLACSSTLHMIGYM